VGKRKSGKQEPTARTSSARAAEGGRSQGASPQTATVRRGDGSTGWSAMDVWERTAWLCLHLLVLLVPIAMSNLGPFNLNGAPLTYDQFDIVKVFLQRGLILIALAAWCVGILIRGGTVRWSRIGWLVLVFLAWVAVTSALSVHPPTAILGKYRRFEGLVSFITYGLTFFMALQVVDRPARVRSLARTLAVGGFLVAFYGLLQVIGGVSLDVARILRAAFIAVTVVVPVFLGWRARMTDDAEARRAMVIGAAIALLGGALLTATMLNNIVTAVAAGSDFVSLDPVRWGNLPFETNRAFSTYGNPDLLGGYILFPWAVTIGLALSERHRLWRAVYWCFTLLNAFVGLTSYVRGAWIAAVVVLVVIVIGYRRARRGTELRLDSIDRTFIASSLVAVVAVVVVSTLRTDAVRNVVTRVLSIFQFQQGSALTRFQIWEAARAAIAERPIFGWGADTFRLLFPRFKPAEYVEAAGYLSVADNVHNYPLQLSAGIGIPGAFLMYGTIGWTLVDSARHVFARGEGRRRLVLLGFWAAVLAYVVHLMFGLSVTGSTIFLWLSMGLLAGPRATEREVAPARARRPFLAVVGVVFVLAMTLNGRFVLADNHYLAGRLLTSGTASVAELRKAIELNPYNEMYKMELGSAYQKLFQTTFKQYLAAAQSGAADEELLNTALGYFTQAEAAYLTTIEYVPYEYDTYVFTTNLYNEAAVYLDPAYYDKAIAIGEEGVRVEPYGPAVRVQLAVAYLGTGEVDAAIEHLEVAASLDSDYVQAHLALATAYLQAGRDADAIESYEHVLRKDPDNAEAIKGLEALGVSTSTDASGDAR